MKKLFGKILRKILPLRLYKLIANGAIIVPGYYRGIIKDSEKYYDLSQEDSDDKQIELLRKYAHIIDKGLHRQDVAPGHSENFYNLLCSALERLQNSKYTEDPSYKWAQSKKKEYEKLQNNPEEFEHLSGVMPTTNISFDELLHLIKARRSNRQFEARVIEQSLIRNLKEVANWASSSCNKQPIEIYVTNDMCIATECLKCCKGGTGFSDVIPSFWAFTANIRGYVFPMEMFLPSIDVSLGAQNVMLAATTLGLSGTILTWAQKTDREEERLRELLSIPNGNEIIFCAVIGYASESFLPPQRKQVK